MWTLIAVSLKFLLTNNSLAKIREMASLQTIKRISRCNSHNNAIFMWIYVYAKINHGYQPEEVTQTKRLWRLSTWSWVYLVFILFSSILFWNYKMKKPFELYLFKWVEPIWDWICSSLNFWMPNNKTNGVTSIPPKKNI